MSQFIIWRYDRSRDIYLAINYLSVKGRYLSRISARDKYPLECVNKEQQNVEFRAFVGLFVVIVTSVS